MKRPDPVKVEWTEVEIFIDGASFGKFDEGVFTLVANDPARAARNKAKARRRRWRKKGP